MIMIGKIWKKMIYNHSWSWSDRKWSAITIRYPQLCLYITVCMIFSQKSILESLWYAYLDIKALKVRNVWCYKRFILCPSCWSPFIALQKHSALKVNLKVKCLTSRFYRKAQFWIVLHSSEIRGLRSTLCPREMLQNLPYFMYKQTHVVFFIFHFVQL